MALSWVPLLDGRTPAEAAAGAGQTGCFRTLVETGGAAPFLTKLYASPGTIESHFPCLLTQRGLLDFRTKQAWLAARLSSVVGDSAASALALVATRGQLLKGLCAQLGVDEATGRLMPGSEAARARPLDVRFEGEAGGGNGGGGNGHGQRHEWFREACTEMIDPSSGLFVSKDGNGTLQPNTTTKGPDHLAYFALLGRVSGLALYHREHLDVQWSAAFLKAVLGYAITADDLECVDPELFSKRIVYLRDGIYASRDGMAIDELNLTFVDDSNDEALVYPTEAERRQSSELKPGGAGVAVTGENLAEYLQLFAERRLLGAIRPQVCDCRARARARECVCTSMCMCMCLCVFVCVRCGALRCGAVRCGAVRCGAVRCGAVR
jgi:E3 ubiquitin-protein ligase HACE1